ncbi:hypothetical protein GQ54DRAFT_310098 [Martensiomyces pterosporus]|nr:hypothetical protein GQ54DRAFT_310098 [Martensiomyces pterosporus]
MRVGRGDRGATATLPPVDTAQRGSATAQHATSHHHHQHGSKVDASIFYPHLHGNPIDYYFYPNSSVPVFCPTIEQFRDFEALVTAIEPLSLLAGVCKIIPPRVWREELERRNRQRGAEEEKTGEWRVFGEDEFPTMKPIVQHFNGSGGIFHQYNVEFHRKLRLAQFFQTSQDASHRMPECKIDQDNGEENKTPDGKSNGVAAQAEEGTKKRSGSTEPESDRKPPVYGSDTVGIAVDYKTGEVRLTSTAADTLQQGIRSESSRAKFQPATTAYRPYPDSEGDPAADQNGVRPPRTFTSDDGRALFVSAKEYAANEELERMYWKNILFQPPMYGADVLGTLFPDNTEFPTWNIRNLPGLLRRIGQRMPGVNDPYLYLGMWKATFAWHVEDMDLYSINYIHFGAPKAWYSIPIEAHSRFEMSMQNVFATDYKACSQFLRHKAFLLSPRFLALQGIPFNRVVQRAGEIMLTFPLGYHAGFNHGFNCAESVNFALDRWLGIAKNSKHCECVKDSVTIDLMEWFSDCGKAAKKDDEPAAVDAVSAKEESLQESDDDACLKDRLMASKRRVSPRRHAAAAKVISAKTSAPASPDAAATLDTAADRPIAARRPGRLHRSDPAASGSKRKSLDPLSPEPSPKRPQQQQQKDKAVGAVEAADEEAVDPTRRLGSLNTPVGVCGACLLPIDGMAVRNGEIVTHGEQPFVECRQCGLTVHSSCSALTFDDGNYKCANCVMDTDQLSCALCAFQNGLLLPVREDQQASGGSPSMGSAGGSSGKRQLRNSRRSGHPAESGKDPKEFAHFLCANFISETFFDFPAAPPSATTAAGSAEATNRNARDNSDGDAGAQKPSIGTRSRTAAAKAAKAAKEAAAQDKTCALVYSSGVLMSNSAKVCGISAIPKGRWSMRCMFCDDKDCSKPCFGAVVQCAHPKCFRAFHPMCAAIDNLEALDWADCKIYCPSHLRLLAGRANPQITAYFATHRCYSTKEPPQQQQQQTVSFLKPNINPHGIWAPTAEPRSRPDGSSQEPPSPENYNLWSLAERRALFLYARAIEVHRRREPDWALVGQRLGRDSRQCRFTYYYIRNNWARHRTDAKEKVTGVDAGIAANQLLQLASGEREEYAWDEETMKWLVRLVSPPEQALVQPREKKSRRKWTESDLVELMDACPLCRVPSKADLAAFMQKYRRTHTAIRIQYLLLMKDLGGIEEEDIQPLTKREQKAIADAAERRRPDAVRFGDVRDELKGRRFAEVLRLTRLDKQQLAPAHPS